MATSEASAAQIMLAVNESTMRGYPHASISSRGAFDWTFQKIVRSNSSGFKLLFLHVQVPDGDGFDDMDSIYASPEDFKSMKHRDRARGLHLLEYFVTRCNQIGIDFANCRLLAKHGSRKTMRRKFCHEVKRIQPDLLIVGSRRLGPFQRVFVGTVSEFCVKHAECPVVTIKRRPDETPQDPVDDKIFFFDYTILLIDLRL